MSCTARANSSFIDELDCRWLSTDQLVLPDHDNNFQLNQGTDMQISAKMEHKMEQIV